MESTVAKAFVVLEAVSASDEGLRVSEIAVATGMTRSNAHRLLRTLLELGYIRQDETTPRYRATLKMWEVGAKTLNALPLKRAAAPVLQELQSAAGETAILSILDGIDVLYLDYRAGNKPRQTLGLPGSRIPALYTAAGRSIVAHRSDGKQLAKKMTEEARQDPKIDLKAMEKEFDLIRKRGFAFTQGGWYRDFNSAGTFIKLGPEPFAAVSLSGKANSLVPARAEEYGALLLTAARRIEARLEDPLVL